MEEKNIFCNHSVSDGYHYDLNGSTLWLCVECEKKLRKAILEQIILESDSIDILGDL